MTKKPKEESPIADKMIVLSQLLSQIELGTQTGVSIYIRNAGYRNFHLVRISGPEHDPHHIYEIARGPSLTHMLNQVIQQKRNELEDKIEKMKESHQKSIEQASALLQL